MGDSIDGEPIPAYDSTPVPQALPPGWWVGVASGDQIAQAERIEYEVFLESGYCEEHPLGRAWEYEAWRDRSSFQVVVNPDQQVTAVVRTIVGRFEELPAGKFHRDVIRPPDPVLEYASLAIPRSNRRQGQAEELYRAVFLEAVRLGAGGIVAIGEAWLLDLLVQSFDLPFERLGPDRWYMGGECFPMGMDLSKTFRHLALRQPSFLEWVLAEIDLRDIPEGEVRVTVESVARTH